MEGLARVSAWTIALLQAGCASDTLSDARMRQVPLTASQINAGQTGRVTLVAAGDRTELTLVISGVPPLLSSRPVHLYTYLYKGSCAAPAADPAYSLTERVLAQSPSSAAIAPVGGPFTLTNVIPAPLQGLERERYAVRVFTAPADGHREIFCGDLLPA